MKLTRIESIDAYDWTDILRESLAEGHNMVDRLLADFLGGVNRFDALGEALYAHLSGPVVVAVAGLNREPDPSLPRAGRIRRLFVLPGYRGSGLARSLVDELIRCAVSHFDTLTVNVGKLDARGFYEHLGFEAVQHQGITHSKKLRQDQEAESLCGFGG
jgi:GNAT superfamily N-acetyltransferase